MVATSYSSLGTVDSAPRKMIMLQPACQNDSIRIEPMGACCIQGTPESRMPRRTSTMLRKPVSRSRKMRKIQPTATMGIM